MNKLGTRIEGTSISLYKDLRWAGNPRVSDRTDYIELRINIYRTVQHLKRIIKAAGDPNVKTWHTAVS